MIYDGDAKQTETLHQKTDCKARSPLQYAFDNLLDGRFIKEDEAGAALFRIHSMSRFS